MKTCPHCHIQVGGNADYCPLCQNHLTGTGETPYFPPTARAVRRAETVLKIVSFVALAGIVIAAAFDFILIDVPHRHFSLPALAWTIAGLVVLRVLLRRRYNGPRLVFNLLLLVSALIVFTDYFNGYTGYSLDLVVPTLCSITLVCNFIFALWKNRFTANALVYLLMNIGVGLLPYLLLLLRIGAGKIDGHSIPWVICLIVSVITFLGMVIFKRQELLSELQKRLHL